MTLSFKYRRLHISIFLSFRLGAFTENYFINFSYFEKDFFLAQSWPNNMKTIDLRVTQYISIIIYILWSINFKQNSDSHKTSAVCIVDRIFIWKNVFFTAIFLFINPFLYNLNKIIYFVQFFSTKSKKSMFCKNKAYIYSIYAGGPQTIYYCNYISAFCCRKFYVNIFSY